VGWLTALTGLGGLVGAAVAAATVRVTRLGRSFLVGVALWGLPLLLLAVAPHVWAAVLAFLLIGVGNTVEDAGLFILVPRAVGQRLAGQALGALELVGFLGLGSGSALVAVLVDVAGPRRTFLVLGAVVVVSVGAYARRFVRLDRALPAPGPELDLLRGLAMFAPLPLVVVEHLATSLQSLDFATGEVVLREGEDGDRFHVIASGTARVSVAGAGRPALGRGDGFGEIALLHDVPRTATVVAAEPLTTLAMPRAAFLDAVSGNRVSASAAGSLADTRLASDGRTA
jgi:MFS family permease